MVSVSKAKDFTASIRGVAGNTPRDRTSVIPDRMALFDAQGGI